MNIFLKVSCKLAPICFAFLIAPTQSFADAASDIIEIRGGKFPESMYKQEMAFGIARIIGKNCESIKFNYRLKEKYQKKVEKEFKATGLKRRELKALYEDLDKTIPFKRLQSELIGYIQKNELVINIPSTFCTVGKKEIGKKSLIGSYLKAR